MDLHEAINAHLQWRQRLQGVLSGTHPDSVNPDLAEADDHCPLGMWIHQEVRKAGAPHGITELQAEHAAFHREAAQVLHLVREGRTSEARSSLETGAFHLASTRTIGAIIRHLRKER